METVAVFSKLDDAGVAFRCPVLVQDGHMLQVKLSEWVDVGSPVKMEADDTMSLGEVSHCRRDGDGYLVWVEVFESLHNVAELSRLARALVS